MNRILRQWFGLACLAALLLIAGPAHPYPYVELFSDQTDWRVGEIFEVQVLARNVTDVDPAWGQDLVLGFGFDVLFARRGLAFTGAAMGPGFDDLSGHLPGNQVAGIASPLDADSLFGDRVLLASLNFECLSVGRFLLGIASDPDDKNGGLFTWRHHEEIFDCLQVNVAAVPVPQPLLLLASGLIGLVLCRRARRESSDDARP
jgi:hypothetical protein